MQINLFLLLFRTRWLWPPSSLLIALLRGFSGTIPTARNSGFAKAWMVIPNCTSAQRGICSTTKNDDVWKKTKWNATKRWIWWCCAPRPFMSINSKCHNWHRFSTDMPHCKQKVCNKDNGNWPAKGSTKDSSSPLSFHLHEISHAKCHLRCHFFFINTQKNILHQIWNSFRTVDKRPKGKMVTRCHTYNHKLNRTIQT